MLLSISCLEIGVLGSLHYSQKLKLVKILNEIAILESFIESQQPILDKKALLKQQHESLIIKKSHLIGNTKLPKLFLKKITKSIPTDCCL